MLYYYVPNGFRWFADIAACLVSYFVLLLKRDLMGVTGVREKMHIDFCIRLLCVLTDAFVVAFLVEAGCVLKTGIIF